MPTNILQTTNELDELVGDAINDRVTPGIVIVAGNCENIVKFVYGNKTYEESDSLKIDDIYDIASLTKVFITTVILRLITQSKLSLDTDVGEILEQKNLFGIKIKHLLSHTSGLDLSLSKMRDLKKDEIIKNAIEYKSFYSSGKRVYYSDQGYFILGLLLEKLLGNNLGLIINNYITKPLGLKNTFFKNKFVDKKRFVPTEIDQWKKRILKGESHNEIAHILDGMSGHAGLFSTGEDLFKFGLKWLEMAKGGGIDFINQTLIKKSLKNQTKGLKNDTGPENMWHFGFGWRLNCRQKLGKMFSSKSFEMSGFTGPQISIDPVNELVIVICTNRTWPIRSPKAKWEKFQAQVNDLVYRNFFHHD